MKRIRICLLALISFMPCAWADGTSPDYSATLSAILTQLENISSFNDEALNAIYDDLEFLNSELFSRFVSLFLALESHFEEVTSIKDKITQYLVSFNILGQNVDAIAALLVDDLPTLNNNVYDIESLLGNVLSTIMVISDDTAQIQPLVTALQVALEDIKAAAQDIATGTSNLNQEETQQDILEILQSSLYGFSVQALGNKLDDLISHSQDANSSMESVKDILEDMRLYMARWDAHFFRFLYEGYYQSPLLRFYELSTSPNFQWGYNPVELNLGGTPVGNFFNWLVSALNNNLQASEILNNNVLYIAKILSTNSQEEAMNEFEQESQSVVEQSQQYYQELMSSVRYEPRTFSFADSHLSSVRSFVHGIGGNHNSYQTINNVAVDISSFEEFGTPSYFDFGYDLTGTEDYWEICRSFFAVLWVLLWCSVFFWVYRVFYRFYTWLYFSIAHQSTRSAPVGNIPLHWD